LFFGHLQPFAAPDALHSIFPHLPACPGVLTSEFFLDDKRFLGKIPLKPDPKLRATFFAEDKQAQDWAQLRLKTNPDDHGHYLRPFAKILLALAARRERKSEAARTQLNGLVAEFPENPLFAAELANLKVSPATATPPSIVESYSLRMFTDMLTRAGQH
jgi:hypothetical protein